MNKVSIIMNKEQRILNPVAIYKNPDHIIQKEYDIYLKLLANLLN